MVGVFAALFANLSARSLPATPTCPGIHRMRTWHPMPRNASTRHEISRTVCWPELRCGCAQARIAAWLSVKMVAVRGGLIGVSFSVAAQERLQGKTDAFELRGVDRVSFQRTEHRDGIAPGRGGRSAYAMCRAAPVGVAYGQVRPVGCSNHSMVFLDGLFLCGCDVRFGGHPPWCHGERPNAFNFGDVNSLPAKVQFEAL